MNLRTLFSIGTFIGGAGLSKGLIATLFFISVSIAGYIGYLHYEISSLTRDKAVLELAVLQEKSNYDSLLVEYRELEFNRNLWVNAAKLEKENRIKLQDSVKIANNKLDTLTASLKKKNKEINYYKTLTVHQAYEKDSAMVKLENMKTELASGSCEAAKKMSDTLRTLTLEDLLGGKKDINKIIGV